MEEVLEQAQLVVAADERRLERLERFRPPRSATTRRARQAGTGAALPLSACSPAASKAIARDAARSVASPTRTVPGGRRLEPAGGVDEVAGDHALVRGPDRDRRLAGQDPGPAWMPGPSERTASTSSRPARTARSASSSWAIGRAPDRHDRVADELLDRPAVAADDVPGEVEVAGQELPGLLGVASLGERREADEVGEQDRDEAALGDRC